MQHLPSNTYLSVQEYARSVSMTKAGIYKALNTNRLKGHKVGGTWVISSNSVLQGRRVRDGRLIGISKLNKGDLPGFLEKRGMRIKR
jgi:hypothetical protein